MLVCCTPSLTPYIYPLEI